MKIIQILAKHQDTGQNLSKISAMLSAPKTSTFSLLRALCQEGYVRLAGSQYHLGNSAFSLAALINSAQAKSVDLTELPDLAMPFIRQLADDVGETVFISSLTPDQNEAIYIARAESKHPIRFMASIGERRPLYSSSGGRALLAFMPKEQREAYLKSFKPTTTATGTVIDRQALRSMIETIQESGIATTSDDTHVGVSAYATPILVSPGVPVAALIVAAPTERSKPKQSSIIRSLTACAKELSLVMGYKALD
ncbi:IclR family transcriptional regulator [Pollutimonas thiosulfatoxidans]|uniref:IclR family transcriptional regulator n=1 Tax=Pollutimonas thiosulfatoxidans TaxID=2028345 RepID=UPI0013E3DCD1|nr:IclR family transcriptional regulator [Pollutimonas thiosulfatoxidans]